MTAATISLRVQPYRLLNRRDAAGYCGMAVKHFCDRCPVRPVDMGRGETLYDVHDLDRWIDSRKGRIDDVEDIVGRLG